MSKSDRFDIAIILLVVALVLVHCTGCARLDEIERSAQQAAAERGTPRKDYAIDPNGEIIRKTTLPRAYCAGGGILVAERVAGGSKYWVMCYAQISGSPQ